MAVFELMAGLGRVVISYVVVGRVGLGQTKVTTSDQLCLSTLKLVSILTDV